MSRNIKFMLQEGKAKVPTLLLVLLLLLILLTVSARYNYCSNNTNARFWDIDKNTIEIFFNTVIALLVSISAAFFYEVFLHRREHSLRDRLKEIACEDLTLSVLDGLEHYQGIRCENWTVNAELRPSDHGTNDRFECLLAFSFHKQIRNGHVRLRFYRENGQFPNRQSLITREALDKEFIWYSNETGFNPRITCNDYEVRYIKINSTSHKIQRLIGTDYIDYETAYNQADGDFDELVKIEFQVKFPIEKESSLIVTHEWPTKGATIDFDYSRVSSAIAQPWADELTGLKSDPNREDESKPCVITFSNHGWILPKSGYLFSWWRP